MGDPRRGERDDERNRVAVATPERGRADRRWSATARRRTRDGTRARRRRRGTRAGSDALDLTFEKFDVERVLEKAGILLSSSGIGWRLENGPGTKAERLAQAKASLKRRLGMELGPEAGR